MSEEPGLQIEEDKSVGAQVINKGIQLFETAKKRPKNLQKIYRFLLTNRPTLEPERAFSAMGLSVPKIRNKPIDDSLNAMVVMGQFYEKLKIPIHFVILFCNVTLFYTCSAK